MLLKTLVALAVAAVAVDATKILVPLYSYSESCWPQLQAAATANPTASFLAILNPDSGPTLSLDDPSLYCVPVLRQKIPNLTLVGYVRTNYSSRAWADVLADVATYKSWSGLAPSEGGVTGSAKLDGIFFDETPTFLEGTSGFSSYVSYSQQARLAFGGKNSTVIFNPGAAASPRLYTYADYVVAFENRQSALVLGKLPTGNLVKKSAIMIHTFSNSTRTLSTVTRSLVPKYGAIYITNLSIDVTKVYQSFGSDWLDFVKIYASFNTVSSKMRRMLRLD